jgi:uncharacterized membrane protein
MKRGKKEEVPPALAPVVERNIQTLLAHRQKAAQSMAWNEKLAMGISRFTGTGLFLLAHVVVIGFWVLINCGLIPHVRRFDPTLIGLAATVSVEAIFLSTFILMTQRRMMKEADDRADLNLQISLLAEYEITRLLTLTKAVAKNLEVKEAQHPELTELEKDVAPDVVLDTIDRHERNFRNGK